MQQAEESVEATDITLVRSEFTENLNTWVKLNKMSVSGVEPKIYTIPTKLKVVCKMQHAVSLVLWLLVIVQMRHNM